MPRDCPLCGLYNTDTAAHCECGYDFHGGPEVLREVNRVGKTNMAVGGVLCLLALLMAVFAVLGGAVNLAVVLWPALLVGAPLFVRGATQYGRTRQH